MRILTAAEVAACNHPRLGSRFVLAVICALLLWIVLTVFFVVGAITLVLFWILFFVWVGAETLYHRFVANMILVSELNYPRIHRLSEEMREALQVRKDFDVFVYESDSFNAFMVKLFFRRAVFLNSEMLETGVSDDEVRWIVGRFVGYWRVQQDAGVWGRLIRIARKTGLMNVFMLPYERAMVYTGDRLGLAGIDGDIATGVSAMQKLLVGRGLGYSVNPVGVIEQGRRIKGSLFAFLARLPSSHPHVITRYVDLIAFAKRRFPEHFQKFDAANPGLPGDLEALSGERTSGGAVAKGVGAILGVTLAFLLWVLVLMVGVTFFSQQARKDTFGDFAPDSAPLYNAAVDADAAAVAAAAAADAEAAAAAPAEAVPLPQEAPAPAEPGYAAPAPAPAFAPAPSFTPPPPPPPRQASAADIVAGDAGLQARERRVQAMLANARGRDVTGQVNAEEGAARSAWAACRSAACLQDWYRRREAALSVWEGN
jgi:hypothetical protein